MLDCFYSLSSYIAKNIVCLKYRSSFLLPQLFLLTEHSLSHLQKAVKARYYKLITLLAHLLYCCPHKFSFYLANSLLCSPLLRLKLITLLCYVQTIIYSLVSGCNSQRTVSVRCDFQIVSYFFDLNLYISESKIFLYLRTSIINVCRSSCKMPDIFV